MRIGDTIIGADTVFVIAEAGVNHNGEISRALEMVDAAADAGADAVKFQTFQTDKLVTGSAAKASYQSAHTGEGSQREMLKALELKPDDHRLLMKRCAERGVIFLSTPFEEESADFLGSLGVVAFKIPSGELTNLPFLRHVAMKKKPMIVSTGMANMDEVGAALAVIESAGNSDIVILHCVSQYPADPCDANLRAMTAMRDKFGCLVGYSDHTLGATVSLAAVALGAAVIEKHFTLDRTLAGPDHLASMEPPELKSMISDIRVVSSALGDGHKRRRPSEENTAEVARKSIVAIADIVAGARIEPHQLAARRPGTGIPPAFMDQVVGRCASRSIPSDTVMQWSDLV